MSIGWGTFARGQARAFPRRFALALGCVALLLMAVVGCTSITGGTARPNSSLAPAYRSSVSVSVSASSATSRIQESQRQQSLTKRAVVNACNTFATTAEDAVDKMNDYTHTLNAGGDPGPTEGPAKDALNNSADAVVNSVGDALSSELRDALNAYADAARDVANFIGPNPSQSQFNGAIHRFNDRLSEARKLCRAAI